MADSGGGSNWQAYAAAADAGGGLLTSAFNVHETRQNRRFQREMSNTAHQREVEDLRKAGLNPILSANGGSGAGTPGGSVPQMEAPDFSTKALTALQAAQMKAGIKYTEAQTDASSAAAAATRFDMGTRQQTQKYDIDQARLAVLNSDADVKTKTAQLGLLNQQEKLLALNIRGESLDMARRVSESKYYSGPGGQFSPMNKQLGNVIHSAKAVADSVKTFDWNGLKNRAKNWMRGGAPGASGKW
jgi:hypothetical protein